MIPTTNDLLTTEFTTTTYPSYTYGLDLNTNRINYYIDGVDAVRQSIYKILNTERYQYMIYNWNYGVEFMDLYGKEMDYVQSEVQRRITEALLQDDRITECDSFSFTVSNKHELHVYFTAHTIYGDTNIEKVVNA